MCGNNLCCKVDCRDGKKGRKRDLGVLGQNREIVENVPLPKRTFDCDSCCLFVPPWLCQDFRFCLPAPLFRLTKTHPFQPSWSWVSLSSQAGPGRCRWILFCPGRVSSGCSFLPISCLFFLFPVFPCLSKNQSIQMPREHDVYSRGDAASNLCAGLLPSRFSCLSSHCCPGGSSMVLFQAVLSVSSISVSISCRFCLTRRR